MNLKSKGLVNLEINGEIYDYKLYQCLDALARVNSQRKAAKELNIAHTVFNRRLIKAEEKLGFKLSKKSGNGTILTYYGNKLLEEYKKYLIQIEKTENITLAGGHISSGLLDSINHPFKLHIYSSSDEDAFELAKRGAVDILTLDDPVIAYERDIDFIPIAYDYLVLISSPNSKEIKSINDLDNLNFVNVNGSAQRLAWNSLNHYDVKYNITNNINSQFDAFKLSRFILLPKDANEPLMRMEYMRHPRSNVPSFHMHMHAHLKFFTVLRIIVIILSTIRVRYVTGRACRKKIK